MIFNRIRRAYYRVSQITLNIKRWYRFVLNDHDCDWVPLAEAMNIKITAMADATEIEKRHLGYERQVREMRICSHILKTLIDDSATWENSNARGKFFGREPDHMHRRLKAYCNQHDMKISNEAVRDQNKLLGQIIGKYMRHWWN